MHLHPREQTGSLVLDITCIAIESLTIWNGPLGVVGGGGHHDSCCFILLPLTLLQSFLGRVCKGRSVILLWALTTFSIPKRTKGEPNMDRCSKKTQATRRLLAKNSHLSEKHKLFLNVSFLFSFFFGFFWKKRTSGKLNMFCCLSQPVPRRKIPDALIDTV